MTLYAFFFLLRRVCTLHVEDSGDSGLRPKNKLLNELRGCTSFYPLPILKLSSGLLRGWLSASSTSETNCLDQAETERQARGSDEEPRHHTSYNFHFHLLLVSREQRLLSLLGTWEQQRPCRLQARGQRDRCSYSRARRCITLRSTWRGDWLGFSTDKRSFSDGNGMWREVGLSSALSSWQGLGFLDFLGLMIPYLTEEDQGATVRVAQATSNIEPRCQGLKVRLDECAFMVVFRTRRSAISAVVSRRIRGADSSFIHW